MSDQDQSEGLFHQLGQHLANAYQQFLDQQKIPSTEDIQANSSNPVGTPIPDKEVVYGTGATPIVGMKPGEFPQYDPTSDPSSAQFQPPQQPNISPMQASSTPPASNVQPVQQQLAPMADSNVPVSGLHEPSSGLPSAMKAQGNLASAAQDASEGMQSTYDTGLAKQQELVDATQQHFQDNQNKDAQLMQAYQDKKIDPNHVINNMSTGSKIMTTLGLLFSGIGSGLTGQKNLALDMINNNIARDLEAQKAEMGKAYNAYQMHREGTKDEFTADIQHQKDNLLAIDAAIEQQKAKLMGPQAVAAATQTQLGIRNQILDLNQKSAMWNATRDALKGQNTQDPAGKIRAMQLTGQLKPEQAAAAFKELDKAQNFESQRKHILDSFDEANKENTIGGRVAHLGAAPASVAALQNLMMPYLKDAEGRINETEIKRVDSLIPEPGDSAHKIATKRQALEDFMHEKSSSSLLKGIGINVEAGSTKRQSQDDMAEQWAKSNPNDPRAAKILQRLGK